MCYAIPGRVKDIKGKQVIVDYFGQEKKAINEFYNINRGDYICAQGGFVIKKVKEDEAKEILEAWQELFFQLQDVDLRLSRLDLDKGVDDKKLRLILDKALENRSLKKEELLYLINLDNQQSLKLIYKSANFLRQKYHKNSCCIHGIIEISNHCQRQCAYCGISADNKGLLRYRMGPEEIIDTATEAVEKYGFQALVLQSGEDPYLAAEELASIIRRIKERVAVLICISFGEVGLEALDTLYQAGARAMLMRFETSNPKIYADLHPGQKLDTRLAHIRRAAEIGYLIMTGALIGLPGQSAEDIINDIYLTKVLGAEMYSLGPFLPHPRSPLGSFKAPTPELVLKTLALARFIDPERAKILITTALETVMPTARREGLLAGANSLMLNLTPIKYRQHYEIYPNKAHSKELINIQIKEAISLLKSLGRAPTDLGVSRELLDEETKQ